jgi:hypothetical protein
LQYRPIKLDTSAATGACRAAGVIDPPRPRHAPVKRPFKTATPEAFLSQKGAPMRLLYFPGPTPAAARATENAWWVHQQLERGAPFCANPDCALHVRRADAQVHGGGNWARLPDGRIFGRGRFGQVLLCDACGTRRGPVRLAQLAFTS